MSEADRREMSVVAMEHTKKENAPVCPFQTDQSKCNKKGGVCSLRLYEPTHQIADKVWAGKPVGLPDGDLRAVCPERFRQDDTIYRSIGLTVLGTATPKVVHQVRFLQREKARSEVEMDSEESNDIDGSEIDKEDVGNIDNVLLFPGSEPLRWCALELQAVYFSGEKMRHLFQHIKEFPTDDMPFPDRGRRPDYRSSGPKRLMPQLQIKVPSLRRWGKKMAVVVDKAFYRHAGRMDTVSDLSNSDIAWFLVDFDESSEPATIVLSFPELQTLERAVEGLTGGIPVTLSEFETKIIEKINAPPKKKRKPKFSAPGPLQISPDQ